MAQPRFTFDEIGINVGEEIVFVPTGIVVKVVSDREIEYKGERYLLSPFVAKFIPVKKACGTYQGPRFFTYNGRLLTDIREEVLKKKRQEEDY